MVFFTIEAKINVGQLLGRVIVCPDIKPASGYWAAVGDGADPPTIRTFRLSASPLRSRRCFLVADIHLYNGGRERGFGFSCPLDLLTNGSAVLKLSAFGQ